MRFIEGHAQEVEGFLQEAFLGAEVGNVDYYSPVFGVELEVAEVEVDRFAGVAEFSSGQPQVVVDGLNQVDELMVLSLYVGVFDHSQQFSPPCSEISLGQG